MPLHPDPDIIVFNLKKRYTGVSATVNALVPLQMQQWRLGYCGTTMSNGIVGMTLREAIALSRKPAPGRTFRIWHVRRDPEMMASLWARDVLRLPIKLVFTSAAQAVSLSAGGLPGRYGVGVFGRVRPDKGTDVFVDALIEALPKLPDLTAIIAGLAQPKYQAYEANLRARVNAAGLSERIVFLGEVPAAKVADWYRRCLVTVACPRYEPFGLTPFEAAACGCALICSRTGAFEDLVVPGEHGWLTDTGDARGLARALLRIMGDPRQAARMGEAARHRVSTQFSLDREAEGIGRVYRQLLDA
jgi:mannosyltransferase